MTSENLYRAFGGIAPDLIENAAPDAERSKSTNKAWVKWISFAACFAVMIIIAIPLINNIGTDNPSEQKAYIFSSYDEFNTVAPDIQIIENLTNMDGVNVTIYGTFVNTSVEDSTELKNYAWFDIEAKRGDEFVATIQLKVNDKDSAAVYVENHSLVHETTIGGVQVFYAHNADMEYWDSVLEVDGNYYNVHSYATDEQSFIEFLTRILYTENQTLSLAFELNGKVYAYNIEHDSEGMIVKVDNTDYYEFLEDGELITDVHILDTELTDYFLKNGGKVKGS